MTHIKNHKMVYELITEFVPYFTNYFRDINNNFRDLEEGSTLTKSLLLAYILFDRVQEDKYHELFIQLQKIIFRAHRMLFSNTSQYQA
jgi:hypothetical protein